RQRDVRPPEDEGLVEQVLDELGGQLDDRGQVVAQAVLAAEVTVARQLDPEGPRVDAVREAHLWGPAGGLWAGPKTEPPWTFDTEVGGATCAKSPSAAALASARALFWRRSTVTRVGGR